jgi:hypothetical protein
VISSSYKNEGDGGCDFGNIYDADSSDDEIMRRDSPILRPSSQSSVSDPENQTGQNIAHMPTRAFTSSRNEMTKEPEKLRVSTVPDLPEQLYD